MVKNQKSHNSKCILRSAECIMRRSHSTLRIAHTPPRPPCALFGQSGIIIFARVLPLDSVRANGPWCLWVLLGVSCGALGGPLVRPPCGGHGSDLESRSSKIVKSFVNMCIIASGAFLRLLRPQTSVLRPQNSVLRPQCSTLRPQNSILRPQF